MVLGLGSAWGLLPLLWWVGDTVTADGPGELTATNGKKKKSKTTIRNSIISTEENRDFMIPQESTRVNTLLSF